LNRSCHGVEKLSSGIRVFPPTGQLSQFNRISISTITHHDTWLTGTSDKGREDGAWSIISSKSSCWLQKEEKKKKSEKKS